MIAQKLDSTKNDLGELHKPAEVEWGAPTHPAELTSALWLLWRMRRSWSQTIAFSLLLPNNLNKLLLWNVKAKIKDKLIAIALRGKCFAFAFKIKWEYGNQKVIDCEQSNPQILVSDLVSH